MLPGARFYVLITEFTIICGSAPNLATRAHRRTALPKGYQLDFWNNAEEKGWEGKTRDRKKKAGKGRTEMEKKCKVLGPPLNSGHAFIVHCGDYY